MATIPAITGATERIETTILQRARLRISKALRGQQPNRSQFETPMPLTSVTHREYLTEESFVTELRFERRRAERSSRPFVLMLLELPAFLGAGDNEGICKELLFTLGNSTRETDIKGWYRQGSVFGIVFTEIGEYDKDSIANALSSKVRGVLASVISLEQVNQLHMSFHVFPRAWDERSVHNSFNESTVNGDLVRANDLQKVLSAKA